MECPFELPIHINLIPCFSEEEVAYIVQAINCHEKLTERYKDSEQLWELAEQDNCDGDCDLEPPHKKCPECIAGNALNTLSEMTRQFIDEIEQALKEAEKE